jgi:transposase
MEGRDEPLPDDIEALKAALIVARAEAAAALAQQSDDQALIAHLKLQIEKLNRDRYGPRSERTARLLDQLELTLEELETAATEDELAAEMAAAKTTNTTTTVASFTRKRPSRKPFPDHLPRERVIIPGPTACACCGGARLSKLGEDITETLEVIPKSWKVIQHVREKFSCRDCEKISQAPASFHVIARGWAGPSLLAMVLFEKFGQHQPLNRQAERQGGRAGQSVDPGRPGRWLHGGADALVQAPRGLRAECRAIAWRRHQGAGSGQRQDRHRPDLGLCTRRQTFWRAGAARGGVLLLA